MIVLGLSSSPPVTSFEWREEGRRYGECEVEPPTQSNTGTSYWEQEGGDRGFITVKLEIMMMAGLPCLETVGKTEQM